MKRLNIPTLTGYAEWDELMLHAVFAVLTDFMETGAKSVDWKEDRQLWKKFQYLYKWWTKIRPNRKDPFDKPGIKSPTFYVKNGQIAPTSKEMKKKFNAWYKASKESKRLDKKWEKEDQRNLHRLIDLRDNMWT